MTIFNNKTYQQWFRKIVACEFQIHNQCTMPQLPLWQQIHKMTGAQSTVINTYMWKIHRQKLSLITTAHLLTSKRVNTRNESHFSRYKKVSQAWHAVTNPRLCARTFGLDIRIVGALSAWRCWECEVNSSNRKQQNFKHTSMLVRAYQSEFISGGLVSVYLVYGKVAVVIHAVFASSCGIRQSKLPTQHMRPESGRWFPLV